jgi:hypothetical protein
MYLCKKAGQPMVPRMHWAKELMAAYSPQGVPQSSCECLEELGQVVGQESRFSVGSYLRSGLLGSGLAVSALRDSGKYGL